MMGTPIVAVGNHKGGSGKTVTAFHLALHWARAGGLEVTAPAAPAE